MKILLLLPIIIGASLNCYAKNFRDPKNFNQGPIASAGPDKTIYLTQTNVATLDGSSSSGDSYQWTEISTDYMSRAIITSPNSKVTTVTGLPQGVFYFRISVTSAGVTKKDSMKVIVDVNTPPKNSSVFYDFPIRNPDFVMRINLRDDTTHYLGYNEGYNNYYHSRWFKDGKQDGFIERGRLQQAMVDSLRGKLYNTLIAGQPWGTNSNVVGQSYTRSQINITDKYKPDTNKTYVIIWKFYFPQPFSLMSPTPDWGRATAFDIHGNDDESGQFGSTLSRDTLYFTDRIKQADGTFSADGRQIAVLPTSELYNKTNTIRITYREGSGFPGQKAFVRIEVNGVQKLYRNTGQVGKTLGANYIKITGLYDWRNLFVEAGDTISHKKFSIVTEDGTIYVLNNTPTVNAGDDQSISATFTTLSGTANDDGVSGNGKIVSYKWTKISGGAATIVSPNSATSNITGLSTGVYLFQLKATDDSGIDGFDTLQVTVAGKTPPVASVGEDRNITLPKNSIVLPGSATSSTGTIASYLWTQVSGPSKGRITNADSAYAGVWDLIAGTYQFQLTVKDNQGLTGSKVLNVVVNPADNIAPTANAGTDKTITLPTNSVSLSGSGTDSDGTVASYSWSKISGPSAYSISNSSAAVTTISGLVQGVYQFELKVTDDKGAIGKDTIQITVNAAPNMPPTANAGSGQTITLPTNTITLNGSGTDSDGSVSSYKWVKIAGPTSGTINNANSASTTVSNLVQGTYQFELTVTDNKGTVGKDTVQVTVNAAPNISPVANAGADKTITLPINSVSLSGSGTDSDGTVASYSWSKISGPSAYSISNSSAAIATISGLVQGVYQFELKVTDDKGAIGKDTIQITVNAAPNMPPTANAGADKTITLPINSVSLSGSGTDSDGTIASYSWSKISGPSAYSISNSSAAATTISGLVQGVYQFELKVTDDKGAIGKDTIQITVNAAPNMPPTANAGSGQTITLPTNTITLNGSGTDSDGSVSSYKWVKIAGPASGTINNANSASTTVMNLVQGTYQFELTVTDNKGAVGKDTVQVTVNAAPNISPVANAGADKTITLPTNSVSLSGSGTDSDGTVASYSWSKISGPSAYSISNSSAAVTTISGLVQGVYQFELKVTDDKGAIGKDTIQITVNAAPNMPPTANAGSGQTITLPTNSVTLSGSGTDSDGSISSYKWVKIAGPASGTINNANSASATVSNLVQGTYQFELTVTDNKGAVGKDTTQVRVNAAANLAPTANAGADKVITLPVNSVILSGSGTDLDGTISSYSWTKISGPSSFSIKNSSSPTCDISGLVEGVYLFELKVTDDKGDSGKDTIQVSVKPAINLAPASDAGTDQTITLPVNTATLSGNGTDADGTITNYLWTKISGPSVFKIANPASAVTSVSDLTEGLYQFELKVTDNNGATAKDTVQIVVKAILVVTPPANKNIAPVADAGRDTTILAPANSITLKGSGNDVDGNIAAYLWTQVSGPSNSTFSSNTSASTLVSGLIAGTYVFEMRVTDNAGAVGRDTIKVTVALARTAQNNNIGLSVYPNPVRTITTLEFNTQHEDTQIDIQMTNFSGKSVYRKQFVASSTNVKEQIDMSNLIKGVYIISVYFDGGERQSMKVVKL